MKQPCVYIMANEPNGTLYIGVTSQLVQRITQHKAGEIEGFTRKYGIKHLVYYEMHETMESAILREKQMKKWNRSYKLRLIEIHNPQWNDLFDSILG